MERIKKPVSILLSLILILGVLTVIPVVTAGALDGVGYLDADGEAQTANGVTGITGGSTSLNTGWYAVTSDTVINSRITCTGDVKLILCSGATLTAHKGITVSGDDNSLTIYGQPEEANKETGKLIIDEVDLGLAGIGGDYEAIGNHITINGGDITVTGGAAAAGIGGGAYGAGENITINGGTVTVTGGYDAAGIGGGVCESGDHITINGGNITVTGGEDAAGIGSGGNGDDGRITLSWTNPTDSIKADSYIGNVTLLEDFRADSALTPAGGLTDNSVIEGKTLTPPGFIGHSLTLEGDIGINYFTLLTDEEIESGAVVDFLWTVGGVEKTDSVILTAANKTDNGYKATCPVAVAEMTCDVTATLTVGGEELATNTYSVKRYADTILSYVYKMKYIASGKAEERYDQLATLVKTMLDYGAKAQIVFKRNTGSLANKDIDYTMAPVTSDMITTTPSDMESGLDDYGLEYAGTTIVYLTETSMRHYYTITDQTKFDAVEDNVTMGGEKVDAKTKDGMIYFELKNIAAPDLDTPYTLTIGESSYDYSVLDYVRACINADDVPRSTFNLVSATYWYSMAANTYFGR